jgi:hypothetical protein
MSIGFSNPAKTCATRTTVSWVIYVPSILLVGCAVAGLIIAKNQDPQGFLPLVAGLFGITGACNFVAAWFRRWTTEIAITDRRIILKHGFRGTPAVSWGMGSPINRRRG